MCEQVFEKRKKIVFREDDLIGYLNDVYFGFGNAMRLHFHDLGFLRLAGYCDNFFVDPVTHRTGLMDLDSSIRVEQIAPEQVFFSRFFDVVGAMRGIHELYCMMSISPLLMFNSNGSLYKNFLNGYFLSGHKSVGKKKEKVFARAIKNFARIFHEISIESSEYVNIENKGSLDVYFAARAFVEIDMMRLFFPFMLEIMAPLGIKPPYSGNSVKKFTEEINKLSSHIEAMFKLQPGEIKDYIEKNFPRD